MAIILPTRSIYYDDVNLIAQPQEKILSRDKIKKELWRIIVSPMAAVVGEKFAVEAARLGLTVCLHRFDSVEKQKAILHAIPESQRGNVWVSVGLNDLSRVNELGHNQVLIDIANGYLKEAVDFTHKLKVLGLHVMVGNVHSGLGFSAYPSGTFVRVGIGGGSVCQTSIVTGYTRGQITEIMECRDYEKWRSLDKYVVADGGIKSSGEAAKAFGAGADLAMFGKYFASAAEAQNVLDGSFSYWGGASAKQLQRSSREVRHVEGKETAIKEAEVKPLAKLVDELWDGISSAVSYSGYDSLTNFIGNGIFEVKQ